MTRRAFTFLVVLLTAWSPMHAAAKPAKGPLGVPHVYKKLPDRDLRVHVLAPASGDSVSPRPAIVLYHGGGWTKGTPAVLNDQAAHCAALGLVVFLAEYRLITEPTDTPEVCIRDAKSAMRWVRAHAAEFGVDPARIAAGGGSAGGHLAAATALLDGFDEPDEDLSVSPRPQVLVLLNPVIDNGPGGYGHRRVRERYREFSPAHNVRGDAPPTLILSGTADTTARPLLLEKFSEAMRAAGARCDLHLYDGGEHGFYRKNSQGGRFYPLTLAEIGRFFHSLGWIASPAPGDANR
jgi:Esterase/lipase